MIVEIVSTSLDPWSKLAAHEATLKSGSFGATATFVGTMRDFNEGDDVQSMVLEHYPGMTEKELEKIVAEAIKNHELDDALVVHRVGEIHPGDPIVLVAVWSAHRKASFVACREIMEYLKSRAPFWKKENLGERMRWVEKNTAG